MMTMMDITHRHFRLYVASPDLPPPRAWGLAVHVDTVATVPRRTADLLLFSPCPLRMKASAPSRSVRTVHHVLVAGSYFGPFRKF